MRIRLAEPGDAGAIAALVIECDRTFVQFAPAAWEAPTFERELRHARDAIAMPERWIRVAEVDNVIAGYATFVAAALTRIPVDDPRLAHLGRLFVLPAYWGTG